MRKKHVFVEIISCLLIILFVYAAVSKLSDYKRFQVQLGQSPILTAYATVISWLIPSIEVTIALLLAIPKLRLFGLYGSFSLMVMFTFYIIVITRFSSYVPCSCGGILENMNWSQHLIFNVFFLALTVTSILSYSSSAIRNIGHYKLEKFFLLQ
jgi:uncharacterized membrane protein YphA (DoxX/SURF4 family)